MEVRRQGSGLLGLFGIGDGSCYQKLSKSKLGPNLEDDYNKAIARNIAIEVLKIKQQQQKKVHLWKNFPSLSQQVEKIFIHVHFRTLKKSNRYL